MIRIERHPLVRHDLREIARHVADTSGDKKAASLRLDEILNSPNSGPYLGSQLPGWRARHGGRGRMITIVFRLSDDGTRLQVAVVAFGGRDWLSLGTDCQDYFDPR